MKRKLNFFHLKVHRKNRNLQITPRDTLPISLKQTFFSVITYEFKIIKAKTDFLSLKGSYSISKNLDISKIKKKNISMNGKGEHRRADSSKNYYWL